MVFGVVPAVYGVFVLENTWHVVPLCSVTCPEIHAARV